MPRRDSAGARLISRSRETLGVVRAIADPDRTSAEFAILVRSDLKGERLGSLLMEKMIRYCRERGIGALVGDVLATNAGMLGLARDLGLEIGPGADATVKRVKLALSSGSRGPSG